MQAKRFLSIFLAVILGTSFYPLPGVRAGELNQTDPVASARALLSQMSPEERIGQLFLVSFSGINTDNRTSIYDLIVNHHIGGVVLLGANGNFSAPSDTATATYNLISSLQNLERETSQGQLPPPTETPSTPLAVGTGMPVTPSVQSASTNYIPLLVGISQDGDGYPNDQILSGLTTLPTPMAIGATWDTNLSQQIGTIAGKELASLGFNLFFGPPLDVLDSPQETAGNGLAADVFGGDPYWVGMMGQAYITGLHAGSSGKMIVIAKHFPGTGSSDRPQGDEPATVRKPLDSLKQIELAPFFSVTGNAPNPQAEADGLLVSHIRYLGFQGNIRVTTRPVSLDSMALSQILSLSPFVNWRLNGGLLISDDLGSPTVRKFYNTTGQAFEAQLVARDAFLAGNDLIYLGNIQSDDAPDNYTSVLNVLSFFVQKYHDDPTFAQKVNDAVVRILAAKYRLYPDFFFPYVIPPASGLDSIGQSQDAIFKIASQSATLISPSAPDLPTVLPAPPSPNDRIVFLTDTRPGQQCSSCPVQARIDVDAMENTVLNLYGQRFGGQITSGHLVSYTFSDMAAILDGGSGNPDEETNLRLAQWIVINILDAEPNQPQTIALNRFLSERQDLLRDKRVIVFSFNAPFYLDATDISKLTAYYCLYSKSAPFIQAAVRLLFQEISASGASPVSIDGVGYDLFTATSPDPNQIINLALDQAPQTSTPSSVTPAVTATPSFKVGDTVSIGTGVILDHNQHPVPDGTDVQFTLSSSGDTGIIQQVDSATTLGVAHASFAISRPGLLTIKATSDPAIKSLVLQLTVSNAGLSVSVITPTSQFHPTPTPSVVPTLISPVASSTSQGTPGFGGWLLMLVSLTGIAFLTFWYGGRFTSQRWGARWAFCSILGGLLAYNYFALKLPGAAALIRKGGMLAIVGVVILGAACGAGAGVAWMRLANGKEKQPN